MIRSLINLMAWLAVGFAILIQQDELGDLLVMGHKLLLIALIVCFGMAILNAALVVGMTIDEMGGPDDPEYRHD